MAELVRAWKEYIKEKASAEAAAGAARRRVPQRVLNYECPPREESYRIPDSEQCDKYY